MSGSGLPRATAGSSLPYTAWLNSEKRSRWPDIFTQLLVRREEVATAAGTPCRARWLTSRRAPGLRPVEASSGRSWVSTSRVNCAGLMARLVAATTAEAASPACCPATRAASSRV